MAFAQLAEATGSEEYKDIALKTFQRILDRRNDPKGRWEKSYPGTRPMKGFALPMIICNMALEVENILPDKTLLDRTIDDCLSEILNVFYNPELGVMLENVAVLCCMSWGCLRYQPCLPSRWQGQSVSPKKPQVLC